MSHRGWLERQWTAFDYCILLPMLARLPLSWGRRLAAFRGLLYAGLERDWRQFSFQDSELYARTGQTIRHLLPEANAAELDKAVARRYQMQSIEEWEAACMIIGRDISRWPVSYKDMEDVQALLKDNPRAVFLTAHFGSSIMGTVMLQKIGLPILGMSSSIVESPDIHPCIRRFYRRKYEAMGRFLNGGRILHLEGNSGKFVRFLKQGGLVVIVGDLPSGANEEALVRNFLGSSCGFAPGAVRMSRMADAHLLAFVCEYHEGSHQMRFSAPGEDPYAFIGQAIRRTPSSWWAADVFPLLQAGLPQKNTET